MGCEERSELANRDRERERRVGSRDALCSGTSNDGFHAPRVSCRSVTTIVAVSEMR